MQKLSITIKGVMPPSKKNSKQIFINRKTGKPFITASQEYKDWETQMLWRLKGTQAVKEIEEIEIEFCPPNNRQFDLTNKAEAIMDLLVKAGIVGDDNWAHVPSLYLKIGEVSKTNPCTNISIYHADDNTELVEKVFGRKFKTE